MKSKTKNVKKEKATKFTILRYISLIFVLIAIVVALAYSSTSLDSSTNSDPNTTLSDYDMSGVSLNSTSVSYDGSEYSLEIEGDLPDGVSVSYTYNGEEKDSVSEAGEYTVVASFTGDTTLYNAISDMTATLTIGQASISNLFSLSDSTVGYDGESHSLEITGDLPDDVTVSYTYNGEDVDGVTNAGDYTVVATITNNSSNYSESTITLEATLVIEGLDLNVDDVVFEDDTVDFDGYYHSLTASNLPDDTTVSYTYNEEAVSEVKASGTYTVVAYITKTNYITETKTATLTINDTEDYEYVLGSTTASLTSYIGDKENVIVPSEISIDGAVYTVTNITSKCFENNTTIVSVEIPEKITAIYSRCFSGCTKLETITFDGDVTYIDTYTFLNCSSLVNITLPSTLTSLGTGAFLGCSSLESIVIPAGVTTIRTNCFNKCTNLSSVTFEGDVTEIAQSVFYMCESLTNITLPETLTTIDQQCFYGCIKLEEITIPSSVESIGIMCFYECESLINIIFSDTTSQWYVGEEEGGTDYTISVASKTNNVIYFVTTYVGYYWAKIV